MSQAWLITRSSGSTSSRTNVVDPVELLLELGSVSKSQLIGSSSSAVGAAATAAARRRRRASSNHDLHRLAGRQLGRARAGSRRAGPPGGRRARRARPCTAPGTPGAPGGRPRSTSSSVPVPATGLPLGRPSCRSGGSRPRGTCSTASQPLHTRTTSSPRPGGLEEAAGVAVVVDGQRSGAAVAHHAARQDQRAARAAAAWT